MGITPQQFEAMKNRLGSPRKPAPAFEIQPPTSRGLPEVILGVDPSLRGTGYGVIRIEKSKPQALAGGTIRCPAAWEHSRCLLRIVEELRNVVRTHHPTVCVLEGLFYAQNPKTTLIMGEARGAAIYCMAESGLSIFELAPRRVKQAIVGYGAAQKLAVAKMVQRMLSLAELPAPDAADAFALALAHAQVQAGRVLAPAKRI